MDLMEARISKGGQVSIPAAIRKRWATDRVVLEDRGDAILLRPLPEDPVSAARGSLPLPAGLTTDDMRARERADEARLESLRVNRA